MYCTFLGSLELVFIELAEKLHSYPGRKLTEMLKGIRDEVLSKNMCDYQVCLSVRALVCILEFLFVTEDNFASFAICYQIDLNISAQCTLLYT